MIDASDCCDYKQCQFKDQFEQVSTIIDIFNRILKYRKSKKYFRVHSKERQQVKCMKRIGHKTYKIKINSKSLHFTILDYISMNLKHTHTHLRSNSSTSRCQMKNAGRSRATKIKNLCKCTSIVCSSDHTLQELDHIVP